MHSARNRQMSESKIRNTSQCSRSVRWRLQHSVNTLASPASVPELSPGRALDEMSDRRATQQLLKTQALRGASSVLACPINGR